MGDVVIKRFEEPDETLTFERGTFAFATIGGAGEYARHD